MASIFSIEKLEASYQSIYEYVSRLNANLTAGYTDLFQS